MWGHIDEYKPAKASTSNGGSLEVEALAGLLSLSANIRQFIYLTDGN